MGHIAIILADGEVLSRIGFKSILDDTEFSDVVNEAGSLDDLAEAMEYVDSAVAVVDFRLPGMERLESLGVLLQENPGVKICLVVDHVTQEIVSDCLAMGILGCVEKSRAASEISPAIRALSGDRPYFSRISKSLAATPPVKRIGKLTHQQMKVLSVMAAGKSNKEIARELGIREGTVKVHVNAAYRTLGVHNRVAAVSILHQLAERAGQENRSDNPIMGFIGRASLMGFIPMDLMELVSLAL